MIARLRAADAVILGRANMDEFAMGSSTETSRYGPARNPWDPERSPGGSSGGAAVGRRGRRWPRRRSAATPAARSASRPRSAGVVGLKPTYGRVSRYGLVAFASSLDQIGPFGREVADVARVLAAIAGRDPMDSTSVDRPVPDYLAALEAKPDRPLRVGLAREFFGEGLDPEVEAAVREAARVFEAEGATVTEISLPNTKHAIPAYYIVAPAEASSNLARYDGTIFGHRAEDFEPTSDAERDLPALIRMMMASRAEGFGPEVKRRIMLGTFVLSAGYADKYYVQALKVRRLIRDDFDRAFKDVDVILGPTSPVPAFKVGEKISDPLAMYLLDVYTGAGQPRRHPRHQPPRRPDEVRPADRHPAPGPRLRRGDPPPRRPDLRAGHRLAHEAAGGSYNGRRPIYGKPGDQRHGPGSGLAGST